MSDFISILIIAIGLSADCFAVSISGSVTIQRTTPLQIIRTAFTFGLFQAIMPVIGWLIGRNLVTFVADYDHWIAFALLLLIGSRMIWESIHDHEDKKRKTDITRGLTLLTLAVATSIDALAVGLTFAFLHISIALASSTIGIVAFIVTISGFLLGKKLGQLIGKRAEIIGGIVLIAIGIRILLSHLL
ncbi:MAG: manganese efflux pump MntP family protein [Dehalococcoidia bacterium]